MQTQRLRSFSKRLFFSGLNLVRPASAQAITPILVYHSIDDSGSLPAVTPSCFFRQMKYLKENNYTTLTLHEYCLNLMTNQSFPPRSVVITFDDGFENNYTIAFPILKNLCLKATIFLATGYMGNMCNWQRTIDIPKLPMMSWEQVKEMSEYGIEFGSHGSTHRSLTAISLEESNDEIIKSKSIIETMTNKEIHSFCYPYGAWNSDIVEIVQRAGYTSACSMAFGYSNGIQNIFFLQRMNINCTSRVDDTTRLLVFKACLSGSAVHFVRLREKLSFLKGKSIGIIK